MSIQELSKIYKFSDLKKDIADKSAHLEKQRRLITYERVRLKKRLVQSITSPSALLMTFSAGFVTVYFKKSKTNVTKRSYGRFYQARANLKSAMISSIKRFSSGVIIGIISSISSRKGQQLSTAPLEE